MDSAETILVAEDTEPIRKLICGLLAHNGYNCIEARDGVEALRLVETSKAMDLLLTDVVMPRMGGAELARQVSRLRPELRILFMSGYSDDPIVRLLERSYIWFLAKPFTPATLTAKVREALNRPWDGLPEVPRGTASGPPGQ